MDLEKRIVEWFVSEMTAQEFSEKLGLPANVRVISVSLAGGKVTITGTERG